METTNPNNPDQALHWGYKALGAVASLTGLLILVLVLLELSGSPSSSFGGTVWTWADKLFLLHVPIILSMMLIPGGIGLLKGKNWGWSLLTISSATIVVMSLFMIMSAGDKRLGGFMNAHLLEILFLQTVSVAILVLLSMSGMRALMKIRLSDIMIAALFALVLLLDWFVSLFFAMSTIF